jgi:hypothetical protein
MKNRAKCKLCNDILESFHRYDYVTCKCGEISIDGGKDYLQCSAKDWKNFLRVDDEGNEIVVTVKDDTQSNNRNDVPEPKIMTKDEKIEMLEQMLKNIENLPKHAMDVAINHYDFYSYMAVVLSILKG